MMFTEENPKDLSLKASNSSETEDKNNINNDNNEVMDNNNNDNNSIDLSVRRIRHEENVSESKVETIEPMEVTEVTLDLSMPSSSVNTSKSTDNVSERAIISSITSGTNRRTQQLSHPQQIRNTSISHWSSSESASPDVQMSDEETHIQMTNGNHINGYLGSDDSASRADADEDLPLPPSPKLKHLSIDELRAKERKMRRLKQDLRNEEMKLVLLKKLRQSQLMKENIVTNLSASANQTITSTTSSTPKVVTNAPLARNGSIATSLSMPTSTTGFGHNRSLNHNSKSHSVLSAPFGRNQNHSLSHGPIGAHGLGQRNSGSNHMPSAAHHSQSSLRPGPLSSMNRTPVTTPPNVVLGYPVQDLRAQQQNNSNNNSILNSHQSGNHMSLATNSPQPNSSENIQTPAQRQAAAKLALRKQLEKTLLQIPPPKPPPPEMHFIPNANNQEFVYYLGLETVVDFLTDSPNQNRPPPDPFECVQCGTDFTPVWKWQDRIDPNRDRPAVICETCVTSNIKKALKAEHTNRLKTAFVKALQQEQEIEQRIASGATSPPLPTISPPPQQNNYNNSHSHQSVTSPLVTSSQSMLPQAPPAHTSMSRMSGSAANAAAAAAAVASSAALLQQMPKLSAAHQSLFAAQAQQLHQFAQSLPQPQPAHMLPFAPLLAAQAYSYSMLGKSSGVPSSDLHRQYLLDMIPPRSLPQGSINWKT